MQIVLVQPTDLSPSYLTEDFWELVDENDIISGYFEHINKIGCETDVFSSFHEAESFICSLNMSSFYKAKMCKKLDRLKRDAEIFNWMVV